MAQQPLQYVFGMLHSKYTVIIWHVTLQVLLTFLYIICNYPVYYPITTMYVMLQVASKYPVYDRYLFTQQSLCMPRKTITKF